MNNAAAATRERAAEPDVGGTCSDMGILLDCFSATPVPARASSNALIIREFHPVEACTIFSHHEIFPWSTRQRREAGTKKLERGGLGTKREEEKTQLRPAPPNSNPLPPQRTQATRR